MLWRRRRAIWGVRDPKWFQWELLPSQKKISEASRESVFAQHKPTLYPMKREESRTPKALAPCQAADSERPSTSCTKREAVT
jgi:hypothetical protein